MYPFHRQVLEFIRASRMAPLEPGEVHSHFFHALPWDIDPLGDLNNGRILTLMDIGRVALAQRSGLMRVLREKRWSLAMAGSAPQYRKRVTVFQALETQTRLVGRDERFFYIEQTMLRRGEPTANVMCRTVITAKGRLVKTDEVAKALGREDWNPPLPRWVHAWIEADAERPWPPE